MRTLRIIGVLFVIGAGVVVSVATAAGPEAVQPGMYWRMDFGASQSAALRYGLSLRRPETEARDLPLPPLASLDFSPRGAELKLAGLPLWQRSYRLRQSEDEYIEDEEVVESEVSEDSWFGGTTTYLIAGGLAVAALLLVDDNDDDPQSDDNFPDDGSAPNGIIVGGDDEVCVFKGTPPFPDNCVERP